MTTQAVESYGTLEQGDFSDANIFGEDIVTLGGERSTAGVVVSRDAAMKHNGVWRAVNMLAADIAKTNRHVYVVEEEYGDKVRDKSHPAHKLLRMQPNPDMSAFNFFMSTITQLLIWGNAYCYIVRTPDGEPVRLRPLDSRLMYPIRVNSDLKYCYVADTVNPVIEEPENILHFRLWTWDGVVGMPPLYYARDTFGMGLGAAKWQSVFFKNGTSIRLFLTHPGKLRDDGVVNRIKQTFNEIYGGVDNAHKTAVLEEGMTANAISVNPKDAQVLELLQMNIKEVANIFGIPPHKLGDNSKTSYSSLEQENQAYLDGALDPIMKCLEEEMMIKLLTDTQRENETHFIEFDRMAWLRADLTTQAAYFNQTLAGSPSMTINEVRRLQNMPRLNDPNADKLLLPSNNFAPQNEAPAPKEEEEPEEKEDGYSIPRPSIDIVKHGAVRAFKRCVAESTKEIKVGGLQSFLVSFRESMRGGIEYEFVHLGQLFEGFGVGSAACLIDKWCDMVLDSVSEFAVKHNENPSKKMENQTLFLCALETKMEAFCNEL